MKAHVVSAEEAIQLRRMYCDDGLSTREIGERIGVCFTVVSKRLRKAGIEIRKKFVRGKKMDFWRARKMSEWNHETAYISGYIWADGSVQIASTNSSTLTFSCQRSDREILEFLKESLCATTSICDFVVKTNEETFQSSSLTISGSALVSCLMSVHGIVPRKSYVDPPMPSVPDEFIGSFLRGCFDGDGSAVIAKGKFLAVSLVGSGRFLASLSDHLSRVFGVRIQSPSAIGNHFRIAWYSKSDTQKLREAMYSSGGFFLARKRDKFTILDTSNR